MKSQNIGQDQRQLSLLAKMANNGTEVAGADEAGGEATR